MVHSKQNSMHAAFATAVRYESLGEQACLRQPLPSSPAPLMGIMSLQFKTDGEAKGVAGRYGVDKLADPGVCGSFRFSLRLSLSDCAVE